MYYLLNKHACWRHFLSYQSENEEEIIQKMVEDNGNLEDFMIIEGKEVKLKIESEE